MADTRAGYPLLSKDKPVDFAANINVPTLFIAGEKIRLFFRGIQNYFMTKLYAKKIINYLKMQRL